MLHIRQHIKILPSLFLALTLTMGVFTGCGASDQPEPVVRTTIAPERAPNDTLKPKKGAKAPEKPKHNIKSFSKNEPVYL
jgi:hypothetical protein